MEAFFKRIQRCSDFDIDRQVGLKLSRWGEVKGSTVKINRNLLFYNIANSFLSIINDQERTHPSPSVVPPLQGFVDAGALWLLLLGGAVQLDENLGARLRHLAAGLQGGVGLPPTILPPLNGGHHLVFVGPHLGPQVANRNQTILPSQF